MAVPVRFVPALAAVLVIVAVLLVFWPVVGFGFVTWDDDVNVYENPYLNPPTWRGIAELWCHPYEGLYAPLTYTFWAAIGLVAYKPAQDGQKASMDASHFHLFNLVVHTLNVLLCLAVVRLLLQRIVPGAPADLAAGIGAMLFGLHPLQTETVAWVTGLKDLLSAAFGLCALLMYLQYVSKCQEPSLQSMRLTLYISGLLALILGLLAKPTIAVIPLIALALETSVFGVKIGRACLRLIPWFVVSTVAMGFAKYIQSSEHFRFIAPLWARPFIAGDALAFYVARLVWPVKLAADYGRSPEYVLNKLWLFATWLVPCWLTLGAVRKGNKPVLTGWLLFVIGLLPVLGLVPFIFQSYSTVADRYVYLSMLGPALVLSWLMSNKPRRIVPVCIVAVGALGVVSNIQARYWKDTTTLFEHTLRVNPKSSVAYYNMGMESVSRDRLDEAIERFRKALIISPDYAKAHNNLGVALAAKNDFEQAIKHLQEAVNIKPDYAVAHYNLGIALLAQNDIEGAVSHLTEAVRLFPDHLQAQLSLGKLMARLGRPAEAMCHFREVVRIDPGHAEGHLCLGMVLGQLGNLEEAIRHLQRAVQLKPDYTEAHNNLAVMLFLAGRYEEAYSEAELCKKHGGGPDPRFMDQLLKKLGYTAGGREE